MSHEAHFRAVLGSKLKKGMYYTLNLKLKFKGIRSFLYLLHMNIKPKMQSKAGNQPKEPSE